MQQDPGVDQDGTVIPRTSLARRLVRIAMAVLGAIGGGVLGLAIMLAIVVGKARAGVYTFSLHDLVAIRWETLPVVLGLPGGAYLGYMHAHTLDHAARRGFALLALGIVVGALYGRIVWGMGEGPWAGGIILGAIGLVVGVATVMPHASHDPFPLRAGVAGATALAGLGALGVIGVAGASIRPLDFEAVRAVTMPDPSAVDAVVFLLGDAGATEDGRTPLLRAMKEDVEHWSDALGRDSATSIVFLGDNVYPVGVRDRADPAFPQDSARLWNQIELVGGEHAVEHSTVGLFLTGNHDWGNAAGDAGFERVANLGEQLRIARDAGHYVALLPPAGEPGPVVRDLRDNVRIVFIDTHWFLQERLASEREAFFARLDTTLANAGDREVIIVAHHPYASSGPHGTMIPGYYSGGVEYLLKQSGTLVQDLNSPVYSEFLVRLRQIFRDAPRPPLVFAGGHDHSLQVLEGEAGVEPRYSLVSGAGSKLSAVRPAPNLAWGGARPGYMMLVFGKDDSVDLFVIAGDRRYLHCGALRRSAVRTCMASGVNSFDVVYSATLLGPSRQEVRIPIAEPDTALPGTPWWSPPIDGEPNAAMDSVTAAVPARVLSHDLDSVTTLPGRTYQAGGIGRILLGDLHRDVWDTPVRLAVLDLDVEGGLRPVERTGGLQTVGLRLVNDAGLEFDFRPIVKTPRGILPDWLQAGLFGDVLDDQMAAQLPFAAVIVNALQDAIGIEAPEMRPVVMPDDERLGEFRAEFAGRVGLFGQHADEAGEHAPGWNGYTRVVDSDEMLESVMAGDTAVDARAYLRIRLIDMLVGDWDRHPGQWRWALARDDGRPIWRPVPEDRDWALAHVDGITAFFTRLFVPQYDGFDGADPDVKRLSVAAAPLDTVVLTRLSRADFARTAEEVRDALPDSVIQAAVARLPNAYLPIVETRLVSALESRRADLAEVADALYKRSARRGRD